MSRSSTLLHLPYINSETRWKHFGQKTKKIVHFFQLEGFADKQL